MKKFKAIILAIMLVAIPSTALAQFSLGIRAGMAIDNLKFSEDIIAADNTVGFTGGLTAELLSASLGIGVDASVLYRYSGSTVSIEDLSDQYFDGGSRSYIDVPVNLKWVIKIPSTEKLISPILFTGPSISFLVKDTKDGLKELWERKAFSSTWNFGVGAEILSKIQVTVAYSLAMSEAFDITNPDLDEITDFNGKDNYWTISAAYMF